MKVLVTSDLHLSTRIWTNRNITQDSYYAWSQIVESAIAQDVSAVILAGDLLDKQTNTSEPVNELAKGLRLLVKHGIEIYFNQGQHEMQKYPWVQAVCPEAVHLHDRSVDIGGLVFTGSDYRNTESFQEFLASADVLVCHQVWQEFMGGVAATQGSFRDIPMNIQLLITGDYHRSISRNDKGLDVLSPGSTALRAVDEPEDKSFFILEIQGERCTPEVCALRTRRKLLLDARPHRRPADILRDLHRWLSAAEAYAEDLPEELKMPIVRATVEGGDEARHALLQKEVEGRAHLTFKLTKPDVPYLDDEDSDDSSEMEIRSGEQVTLSSGLSTYVSPQEAPEVFNLSQMFISGNDPQAILFDWVQNNTGDNDANNEG